MAKPVVLITGCSQGGIGYGLCEAFLEAGCIVYATARRQEAMAGLSELGANLLALDVTAPESIKLAVDSIINKEERIDILVNNAGLGCTGPLVELPINDIRKCFDTNVYGVLEMVQAVAPTMVSRRQGKIVNIGSIVGYIATPFAGTYCASKAAIHSLSDSLRLELKPFGVDVMVIAPGSVRSNIGNNNTAAIATKIWKLYAPYEDLIKERANASQGSHSTPTDIFARQVVSKVLQAHPPSHYSLGAMSFMFYVFRWLPTWLLDFLLSKRFKLDRAYEVMVSESSKKMD